MRRSVKITLKFTTEKKQKQIRILLSEYRLAVNFYIKSLWTTKGGLNKETLERLTNTRLSERYKSQALKQALETVISTKLASKATHRKCSIPVFKGQAVLDSKFVTIEDGKKSFDLIVKLSSLQRGKRITLPSKHTVMTRKWLSIPDSKFIQGCSISETSLTLWIDIHDLPNKTEGRALGLDLGVKKLISDSDGNFYGRDFVELRKKIQRKRPKSKAKQRALKERDNMMGRVVNQIPWKEIKVLGIEELNGIKTGKQKNRGKNFRKAMAPWVVRQVVSRIENKASENRVCLIKVDPSYTSQTCPVCRGVHKENRKGEEFVCISCGYTGDADHIGAMNILVKTLEPTGSLESPVLKKRSYGK